MGWGGVGGWVTLKYTRAGCEESARLRVMSMAELARPTEQSAASAYSWSSCEGCRRRASHSALPSASACVTPPSSPQGPLTCMRTKGGSALMMALASLLGCRAMSMVLGTMLLSGLAAEARCSGGHGGGRQNKLGERGGGISTY